MDKKKKSTLNLSGRVPVPVPYFQLAKQKINVAKMAIRYLCDNVDDSDLISDLEKVDELLNSSIEDLEKFSKTILDGLGVD